MPGFFDYPSEQEPDSEHGLPGFLDDRGEEDWGMAKARSWTARRARSPSRRMSDGEVMRLSYEAFESLSARNPALARHILQRIGSRDGIGVSFGKLSPSTRACGRHRPAGVHDPAEVASRRAARRALGGAGRGIAHEPPASWVA